MPGNEISENIHNFFDQDNSSQNQSQFGGGGWSILNNNQWVGIQRQNGVHADPHANNYASQSPDSEHGNGMQLTQTLFGSNPFDKSELIRSQPINQHQMMNGYMYNSQGPTMPNGHRLMQRNFSPFDRPESSEVPVNFDFLGGQQQPMRSQHQGISQPRPIQSQRIIDMQLWQQQQQIMQQQQLLLQMQQGRQANINQTQSALSGVPVNNTPNNNIIWSNEPGNMSWVQRPTMHGFPNGSMFSCDQEQSLYGAPVTSMIGSLNHQSQFQGSQEISHDFLPALNHHQQVEPIEEKSLFNTDGSGNQETNDNIQKNAIQSEDLFSSFPSLNSGSWSALMQEAVEASSSDTGLNEEWSGLNLHNSSAMFHDNHNNSNNNASSLTSTLPLFSDADTNSNFRQPIEFSSQQNEATINNPFDQQKQQTQFSNVSSGVWVPKEKLPLHKQSSNDINAWSSTQSLEHTVRKSIKQYGSNNESQQIQTHDKMRTINMGTGENQENSQQLNMGTGHIQESNQQVLSRHQANYGKNVAAGQFFQNKKERITPGYQNETSGFVSSNCQPGQNAGENSALLGNDSQSLADSSLKGQKSVGPRKFQFHPMGSLEMSSEPMVPTQSVMNNLERGHVGQPKFSGHALKNVMDSRKGNLSDLQRNKKASEEIQYRGSGHSATPTGSTSCSQNMLELLHKVDQSTAVKPVGFSEQDTQSERNNLDNSHFQPRQSPSFQEFGLKLAPPSQRQSISDHALSSQTSLHIGNGFIPKNYDSEVINKEAPSRDTSQIENHSNTTFISGNKSKEVMHSNFQRTNQFQLHQQLQRQQQQQPQQQQQQQQQTQHQQQQQQQLQQQQQTQHQQQQQQQNLGKRQESHSVKPSDSINTSDSQPRNTSSQMRNSETRSIARPSATSAVSQHGGISKMLHNVWTNISSQHCIPPQKIISNILQSNSPPSAPQKPENNHNKRKGESFTSSPQLTNTENHSVNNNSSQQMPPPNNVELSNVQKQHNDYSHLKQMQEMKGVEPDLTQRADNKRLKGADYNMDNSHIGGSQQGQRYIYGQNTVLRETDKSLHKNSFPTDARMLSFSSRDTKENNSASMSHDRLNQHDIQNQSHPHISPQMAPLWFEKYGNCNKNGQLVENFLRNENASGQKTQNYILSKISERKANRAETIEKDASIVDSTQQSKSVSISSPSHSVLLEVTDNNKTAKPKKRKSETADLVPWHKEVTQGMRKLLSISIMEQKWAWSMNRLIDKLEDDFEMIYDGVSTARPRRRLTLMTQLMQQIIPSIPSRDISANAASSYERIIYVMAKLILGDACSLTCSASDLGSGNMSSGKHNLSEREGYSHFSRFVEDIVVRSKKTEDEFLSLDGRASILDVRLECQDLERESIMNRFVKFHGGSQSDGTKCMSISEITPRRAYPQRQVTAHALPRNVPEGANCISL